MAKSEFASIRQPVYSCTAKTANAQAYRPPVSMSSRLLLLRLLLHQNVVLLLSAGWTSRAAPITTGSPFNNSWRVAHKISAQECARRGGEVQSRRAFVAPAPKQEGAAFSSSAPITTFMIMARGRRRGNECAGLTRGRPRTRTTQKTKQDDDERAKTNEGKRWAIKGDGHLHRSLAAKRARPREARLRA